MAHATAKNYPIDRAPRRIELLGDKTVRPEPAEHIIEFPGGAIEVSRTSSGDYWAHIIVNRGWAHEEQGGMRSAAGVVVDARIDTDAGVVDVPYVDQFTQIAVLIRSVKP